MQNRIIWKTSLTAFSFFRKQHSIQLSFSYFVLFFFSSSTFVQGVFRLNYSTDGELKLMYVVVLVPRDWLQLENVAVKLKWSIWWENVVLYKKYCCYFKRLSPTDECKRFRCDCTRLSKVNTKTSALLFISHMAM